MTVAAVVMAMDMADALADAAGRASVRRIAEVAWSGGALPIVVVADDVDGRVSTSLSGTPAILERPLAAPGPSDLEVSSATHGAAAAQAAVLETDAVLLWPARMTWVDPETVTSLIEGHGAWPATILRPAFEGAPGWPVLVPSARLATLLADPPAHDDGLAARLSALPHAADVQLLELGDPGVVRDRSQALDSLPRYEGPAAPVSGPPPDWGAEAGERADDEDLGAAR